MFSVKDMNGRFIFSRSATVFNPFLYLTQYKSLRLARDVSGICLLFQFQ